ncbi:DNA recombination protein RmuC [Candidatus Saccharibacteria bacterium]|nr:DNA recombination protein RmuC [Candidatus Saccharibacteria bacterium]
MGIVFVLGVLVIVLTTVVVVMMIQMAKLKQTDGDEGEGQGDAVAGMLKQDLVALNERIERLNESVNDKMTKNSELVRGAIEKNNEQMRGSVQKQLGESARIVQEVSQRLTKLDETNKRVVGVADELKTLQAVLQNPKQRGVFGEVFLESVLENVLPVGQYEMQHKFKGGDIVDAVILLDKGKMLPVDSKFSLENYNRMLEASGEEKKKLLKAVKDDLKGRIDETAKYIRPNEGTMDFAFMFIPSESLYYDMLIANVGTAGSARDLIDYAFRDKRVIIVSPTTLLAYLQTILQGLRSLQIEEQAKDIQKRVGQLGAHIENFEGYMVKLGNSLGTTVNHFNAAHKEVGKIDKDVVRIAGGEVRVEPLQLDKPA